MKFELFTKKQEQELIQVKQLLEKIFTNKEKAKKWLVTDNPHFGHCTPFWLIFTDRGHKVIDFIKRKKEEIA